MASLTAQRRPTDLARGPSSVGGLSRRRPTARRQAPWWLAGLLVGCLLPAGFASLEASRPAERMIQICILAPALIRASSRLQARRRARRRWPSRRRPVSAPSPRRAGWSRPVRRAVAAHDVLTRRGPPALRRP